MKYDSKTTLGGRIAFTRSLLNDRDLMSDHTLFKFVWVESGVVNLSIDHVVLPLEAGDIVSLTPFQRLEFVSIEGEYGALLFNTNFYCIYGHDSEVSCSGLLFHGGTGVPLLHPQPDEWAKLQIAVNFMQGEFEVGDNLQEEMLRILLKRFIIICTRAARRTHDIGVEKEHIFDIARQFYVLVDNHYRDMKQVRNYAALLNRSPKTLSNIFATCELPSPLQVIHSRVEAEAKRLLLYSDKSAKEIADILGFDDLPTFSRFFKTQTGTTISQYRNGR